MLEALLAAGAKVGNSIAVLLYLVVGFGVFMVWAGIIVNIITKGKYKWKHVILTALGMFTAFILMAAKMAAA